jgi:ribosomal protein L11 methylase PrmA
MATFQRDPGSFRDPAGYVFSDGQRVLRGLSAPAGAEFDAARACGLLDAAESRGLLIASRELATDAMPDGLSGARGETPARVLEHPRLPMITYPYEWTFGQLKDAALCHLELLLLALAHDFELSDATAYNMQFDCGQPLHIDVLSLRRYRPGRPWEGYHQFCRQFLYPLLVESRSGLLFQRLYRGNPAGLSVADTHALIPAWKRWTSLNIFLHVQLQAAALRNASSNDLTGRSLRVPDIPKSRYVAIIEGLRDWIAGFESQRPKKTYWADYAKINSYSEPEKQRKLEFVADMVRQWGSSSVLDVGGNAGDYSEAALAAGAARAYCLDGDVDALEAAYVRRKSRSPGLLPMVVDWSDPSPGQGWAGAERRSLQQRLQVDTVMALAVVHHIAIGGNVPLQAFVRHLFEFGERVIVEFVPKSDPMVQGLLRSRDDIFDEYSEEHFVRLLEECATIVQTSRIREGGRVLFACTRR